MRRRLPALLLLAAVPALGAATGAVRRGDLVVRVEASGTVVPEDVFRLKAPIEGRVESVTASSGSWRGADETLATLADRELAAMIDARGDQNKGVMEDRWSQVYRPEPVRCPETCYVLKVYAKERAWVNPQAVLIEAARLKLVGRVGPERAPLIRNGMKLTFWAVDDPARKLTAKIARFALDADAGGGTFSLDMTPGLFLAPGTRWEGELLPEKTGVLLVPTSALIVRDGVSYLPVRVKTGLSTPDLTEVVAGAEDKREFLTLGDAPRTAPEAAPKPRAPEPSAGEKAPAAPPPTPADDKGYGGEDPYGQQ